MQFINTTEELSKLSEWLITGWSIIPCLVTPLFDSRAEEVFGKQIYLEAFLTSRRADPVRVRVAIGDWIVWNVGTQTWVILTDGEFQQNYKEISNGYV